MHMYNDNYTNYGNRPGRFATLRSFFPQRVTVLEGTYAVLQTDGRFDRVLETGQHRITPRNQSVVTLSALPLLVHVSGQEVLTGDGASVRATVVAIATITDPLVVLRTFGHNWVDHLHLQVQMALRNLLGGLELEAVLERRNDLVTDLTVPVANWAGTNGVDVSQVAIRDLVVPGALRTAVADVVAARLEGRAALERARGETAALRSLANAAKAIDANPSLLQLRLIQQMENSSGNTYVLGAAPWEQGALPTAT